MDRPELRSAWPFAGCLLVGLLVMLTPQYDARLGHAVLAMALFLAAGLAGVAAIRRRTDGWLDALPAGLTLLALGVVIDGSGGTGSPLVPLVAVPVLWTALFGRRRDLVLCGVANLTLLLGPIVVIGGEHYPWSHAARAVLWTAITFLLGPAVQNAVHQWRAARQRQQVLTAELRAVLDGSRLACLVTCAPDGTVRTFGVGAQRLLGYRPDEVVGRHTPALWHDPDELAEAAAQLGVGTGFEVFRALAEGEAEPRTWRYVRRDGSRVHVNLALTALRTAGETTGYLGVAIDCTDEVRRQREIDRANARWQFLVEHLADTALLTLDRSLRIGQVAGGGALAVGLRDAEGRLLEEFSTPENMRLLNRMRQRAWQGEVVSQDMVSTANGREQEVVMTRLFDDRTPSDVPREVLLLARDVSRERRRADAVARERDRAELFFNQAPTAILVLDAGGRIVRANPAACQLLGRSDAALTGTPLEDLSALPDDTGIEEHLGQLTGGREARGRWQVRTGDGESLSVALSSARMPTPPEDTVRGTPEADGAVLMHLVDVSEQERYQARLEHLADHDPLTGLCNRRRFEADLEQHLGRARRYGARGAVLMMDLDHFKEVNDSLGHAAGDQLIICLAAALRGRLRGSDTVARLGGDEFAILLPEADRTTAQQVAQDVLATVREEVSTLQGAQQRVTASIGVLLLEDAKLAVPDVMSTVDMLLYDAKEGGRDQYALLDPAQHAQPRTAARMMWADRIEQAIAEDGFELHLQPILALGTGRIEGAEALVRMRHDGELVPPSRFLYIAERSDLVVSLDRWVVRRSLALLEPLQERQPGFRLEVNLSGRSVGDPGVEREVVEGLRRHQVDPRGLVLEITETTAVADLVTARRFAERVTGLGCRFALDDFGAGFGSFYYLKHLIFDYVKIDGEFISNCHRDPRDRAILHAIVEMTRELGKQTIAEFVSESAILDVLREEGVDHAQGFHIGAPVPAHQFLATAADRALAASA